jgi:hypothetical protein
MNSVKCTSPSLTQLMLFTGCASGKYRALLSEIIDQNIAKSMKIKLCLLYCFLMINMVAIYFPKNHLSKLNLAISSESRKVCHDLTTCFKVNASEFIENEFEIVKEVENLYNHLKSTICLTKKCDEGK